MPFTPLLTDAELHAFDTLERPAHMNPDEPVCTMFEWLKRAANEIIAYRDGVRVVENNVDHDGDLLRTVYLTGFERMVIESWRDRLATDDTIDRTLIEILGKLAGDP